jgi:uncharacterized membrane protein
MKINTIQNTLDSIRNEQGEGFEADAESIQKAFQQEDSAFSNLTIKVLSVLGGVLAGGFLTGFLFITGIGNSPSMMIIIGMIFTAGSIVASKHINNLTLDTLSITLYFVGVMMIWVGFEDIFRSNELLPFILIAVAIATLFFSENFMLVFFGTLLFHGALIYYFEERRSQLLLQLPMILCCFTLLWLTFAEARIITYSKKANIIYKPLQAGFFVAFAAELLFIGEYRVSYFTKYSYLFLSVAIGFALLLLLYRVMQSIQYISVRSRLIVYVLALAVIIPTVYAPYISGALLLIVLTFHYGFKSQVFISILLLIYGTSRFYYNMEISLLYKSVMLFSTGLIITLVWYYFTRQIDNNEEN